MTNRSERSIKNALNSERYRQHSKKEKRRKKLQSTRKKLKRNYQPKQARQKNWIANSLEDWDDLDYEQDERIMPHGERERRHALERAAFESPEAGADEAETSLPSAKGLPGLVIEKSKGLCRVDLGNRILLCHIRGALNSEEIAFTNAVAVGDEVLVSESGAAGGVIETVLPRRSVLARPDVFHSHLQQVIVANVDQLLVVSSWREPVIWLELLDRYLIAAERNHLPALICVNKMDLAEDEAMCQAMLQPYQALGYPVILASALTGQGVDELRALLRKRTTVLAGLSGVGKSSLLAAIQPDLQLRTGMVSEHSGEGRHTTTQVTLIRLETNSVVVDTPGIREFGLSGLGQHELSRFFPEITALAPNCRFANCAHIDEPGCAVQTAKVNGTIAASRYHSYQQIYASLSS